MGSRGITLSLVCGKFSGEVAIVAWQLSKTPKNKHLFWRPNPSIWRPKFLSYFFVKKYLLVGASSMLWAGESVSGSVDQWISERYMFVTPIRLDLPLETNQISCCKGKWYVRRFDPDTVENGHIYSSIKRKYSYIGLTYHFLWVRLRILWADLIITSNWIL